MCVVVAVTITNMNLGKREKRDECANEYGVKKSMPNNHGSCTEARVQMIPWRTYRCGVKGKIAKRKENPSCRTRMKPQG